MERNCPFEALVSQLGINLNFKCIERKFKLVDVLLAEAKETAAAALATRQRNIRLVQENQLKFMKESNSRLVKQKLQLLDTIDCLKADSEELTREKVNLKEAVKESQVELQTITGKVEELKEKVDEMNWAIENRQRAKTAFSIAIGWYQMFLRMKIFLDASNFDHDVVVFGTFDSTFHPSEHKIPLLKQNDGYRLEGDDRLLSGKELLRTLARTWELYHAALLSQQSSELSSTQVLIDNSRYSK